MWKLLFLPLMVLSLAVIIRPPIIFSSQLTPDSDPVRYGKSNFSRTQCLKITWFISFNLIWHFTHLNLTFWPILIWHFWIQINSKFQHFWDYFWNENSNKTILVIFKHSVKYIWFFDAWKVHFKCKSVFFYKEM